MDTKFRKVKCPLCVAGAMFKRLKVVCDSLNLF